MSTISDGTTIITPTTISGYEAAQDAGNVLHPIIGTSAQAVTLRPAGLRSGTMTAVFSTLTLAQSLMSLLSTAKRFTLADASFTSLGMTFVLSGKLTLSLDTESFAAWLVVFDFQEVS